MQRHVDTVKQGMLVSGTDRRAFLEVWGTPDRTFTVKGETMLGARWSAVGGQIFRKDRVYDVWEYGKRGVTLYFDNYYLASWNTERTTEQLRQ